MEISETLCLASRDEWRAWLERNHAVKTEIWLIYFKKHTRQPSIPYDHAVEEALCFGWVDGIVKSLDDCKYAQRFTPRKKKSNWSEPNRERVKRLIAEGRMTEAGLAKVEADLFAGQAPSKTKAGQDGAEIPDYFKEALMGDTLAWENFTSLAPSYRRQYLQWVASAKREETRRRRLAEAKELLTMNKRLGMK